MTLQTEIATDPLALGYAGMTAQELLASLMAPTRTRTVSRMVSARAILSDCAGGAVILDKLEAVAVNVSEVKWAMFFLKQPEGVDAGSPATLSMIDQLEQGLVLTEAEAEALRALSTQPCSRLEELGLPTPILADVIEAMP
jgi:hypothetical protein